MADSEPPFYPMDSQHRGANVVITAYSLVVYTISVGIIRLVVTRDSSATFSFDDASSLLAVLFSIAGFVSYSKAAPSGLGSHQATLNQSHVDQTMQLVYTSQLLGIVALWAAKLSSAALRWRVESNSARHLSWNCKITLALATIWGPLCLILIALQCDSPAWKGMGSTSCTSSGRMQYTVVALNALSDLWFALDPLPLFHSLQMKMNKRIRIILLMASRLSVPIFMTGQILAIRATERTSDKTWARATQSIWEMIVIFVSVVCSVVPRTQKFWGLLQSGGLRVTDDSAIELSGRRQSASSASPKNPRNSSKRRSIQIFKEKFDPKQKSHTRSRASQDSQEQFFPRFQQGFGKTTSTVRAHEPLPTGTEDEYISAGRPGNSILQTMEVTLQRD